MLLFHYLALFGYGVDEKVCAYIVHVGHKDGAILWGGVRWVDPILHS